MRSKKKVGVGGFSPGNPHAGLRLGSTPPQSGSPLCSPLSLGLPCMLSHSVMSDSLWPYQSPLSSIFQARILEWLPLPTPGDLPNPGIEPTSLASPALAGRFFTASPTWEAPHPSLVPSGLAVLTRTMAQGYTPSLSLFLSHACILLNWLFIKLPSNRLILMCHLFPVKILTDTILKMLARTHKLHKNITALCNSYLR